MKKQKTKGTKMSIISEGNVSYSIQMIKWDGFENKLKGWWMNSIIKKKTKMKKAI